MEHEKLMVKDVPIKLKFDFSSAAKGKSQEVLHIIPLEVHCLFEIFAVRKYYAKISFFNRK